jgi:hypothetical protein
VKRVKERNFLAIRFVPRALILAALVLPGAGLALEHSHRSVAPSPGPATSQRASEGRVVEVRRMTGEITLQTSRGIREHVVVPRTAVIQAPEGGSALSRIHAGMAIHVDGKLDSSGRLVAKKLSAH